MKIASITALGLSLFVTITGAAGQPTTQSANDAAMANNLFAVDLYLQVDHAAGNLCISPYSISSALDMAAAGAAGNTAQQMLAVLHWTVQPTDLPPAAAALMTAIETPRASQKSLDAQITIADALFGQTGYPYRQDFLNLLADQYGAALQQVDFARQPARAVDQVNRWAAEKTHDRIKHAIDASAINPQTRMILVDAIYFKANWDEAFSKSATKDLPFYKNAGEPIPAPTLRMNHEFGYMGNDSVQIAELPYNGDFSMVVLLPRQRDGLPGLEKSLTSAVLQGWFEKLSPQLLAVHLPRFAMEGQYEMSGVLRHLGMNDAFDANTANFSSIVSNDRLRIDQVIHKTFISVDEAGTEAAAVTSVTMRATAAMPHGKPVEPIAFDADHPFLFLLRHRSTGTILFMGRLTDPTS